MQFPADGIHWSWVLPLLLLAAALSAGLLASMAFDVDEAATALYSGLHRDRIPEPGEVLGTVVGEGPSEGLGYPLLIAVWHRMAGSSEVALRSLSWFGGLLALAWTWRAGREMFGAVGGLVATALLATSLLFLAYMANARAYALVVLFTVMSLCGYWRVALRSAPAGHADRALLLTGGIGLVYSHYYGALLLPALGLFHLLMVRRDRRWLQVLALFSLTGLAFLPVLNTLLQGIDFILAKPGLAEEAMAPHVAVARIIEIYSNGLIQLLPKVAGILFGLSGALLLHAAWRRRRERETPDAAWLLVFVTFALFAMILMTNVMVGSLAPNRARYAIGLWPLFCLLIGSRLPGTGLARPPRIHIFHFLLALFLVTGLVGNIRSSLRDRYIFPLPVPPFHLALRDLMSAWQGDARLVVDQEVRPNLRSYHFYTWRLGNSRHVLETMTPGACDEPCLAATVQELLPGASLWLMLVKPDGDLQARLQQALEDAGFTRCQRTDYSSIQPLTLIHLVQDASGCN